MCDLDAINILTAKKSFSAILENEEDKKGWLNDFMSLTAEFAGTSPICFSKTATLTFLIHIQRRMGSGSMRQSGAPIAKPKHVQCVRQASQPSEENIIVGYVATSFASTLL